MIIQFSDLLSKRSRKKEISLSFPFEKVFFEGDEITAVDPVCVEGMITTYEDVIVMKATIKTKLNLICSRCIDTFIYPIDIDIEERFTNNEELRNEEEVIFVEGDSINITEIIENSIISTLPIKRLCRMTVRGYVLLAVQIKISLIAIATMKMLILGLQSLESCLGNKEV